MFVSKPNAGSVIGASLSNPHTDEKLGDFVYMYGTYMHVRHSVNVSIL